MAGNLNDTICMGLRNDFVWEASWCTDERYTNQVSGSGIRLSGFASKSYPKATVHSLASYLASLNSSLLICIMRFTQLKIDLKYLVWILVHINGQIMLLLLLAPRIIPGAFYVFSGLILPPSHLESSLKCVY